MGWEALETCYMHCQTRYTYHQQQGWRMWEGIFPVEKRSTWTYYACAANLEVFKFRLGSIYLLISFFLLLGVHAAERSPVSFLQSHGLVFSNELAIWEEKLVPSILKNALARSGRLWGWPGNTVVLFRSGWLLERQFVNLRGNSVWIHQISSQLEISSRLNYTLGNSTATSTCVAQWRYYSAFSLPVSQTTAAHPAHGF